MMPATFVALALGEVPEPDVDAVARQLKEVFQRPEFTPPPEPFWLHWLVQALTGFLGWLSGLYETSPPLFWVLLVGCVVVLVLLLTHIIWTLRRVWYASGRPADAAAAARREALSQRLCREAERWAAAGDFTEAIRCLFLALVHRFDESGRVDFQAACTNREYLALFAERPPLQAGLRVFVDVLDDHWYGQRPSAQSQYAQCRRLYDEFVS